MKYVRRNGTRFRFGGGGDSHWLARVSILAVVVMLVATLVAPCTSFAQPSAPFTVQEFALGYSVENGEVVQEVRWRIEALEATTLFVITLGGRDGDNLLAEFADLDSASHSSVAAGDILSGSYDQTEFTTGDTFQYRLNITSVLPTYADLLYLPGPTINEVATFPGPPTQAPANFTISAATGATLGTVALRLAWDELADDTTGHTDITAYEIQYRVRDDADWAVVSPAHSGTEGEYDHVLSRELALGGTLRYRIRASNQITELENGPQAPWSEEVVPVAVTADLNNDGNVGADDMLILYYSLELGDEFGTGTDYSTATAGGPLRTFLGGLARISNAASDARILNAWDRARILERYGDGTIDDLDGTAELGTDDAIILYFASAFRALLGNGTKGGFEAMRLALLEEPSGLEEPNDDQLQAVLRRANDFLTGQN